MKFSPVRFAFTALASLALATSANAAEILNFSQGGPSGNTVTAAPGSLSTTGTQVVVGALVGIQPPVTLTYIETFNFTSSAAVTGTDGNQMQTGFSGTFSYTNLAGAVQIAGTVSNATLQTITNGTGGTTGSFNASNVTFTTIAPAILATLFPVGTPPPLSAIGGTYSLTLNNIVPNPATSLNFTARAAGIITAQAVPEPASVVMTSMALVAGLGGLGLRRVKASRA